MASPWRVYCSRRRRGAGLGGTSGAMGASGSVRRESLGDPARNEPTAKMPLPPAKVSSIGGTDRRRLAFAGSPFRSMGRAGNVRVIRGDAVSSAMLRQAMRPVGLHSDAHSDPVVRALEGGPHRALTDRRRGSVVGAQPSAAPVPRVLIWF
jgi:hypothetical protein